MRSRFPLAAATLYLALGCGSDAGDDWSRVSSAPQTFGYLDVWAFADDDVWLIDGTATIQRYDGEGFSALEVPSAGGVACIYAVSDTEVYLCGGDDVLVYDGTNFTPMGVSEARGLDGISGVWASGPDDVWAIGSDAIVAHFDGTTWTGTIVGSPFPSSIWGTGAGEVYLVDTFELNQYDGSTWTEIDLDTGGGEQVWGTGPDDVWVMTDSYELAHFDGTSWELVETGDDFVGDLAAVWGPEPDDLWAAGTAGSVARYNGSSWNEVRHQRIGAPYLQQLVAIHGSSATNIWAVGTQLGEGGGQGLIFRYQP
ncbi:MAG: hypothetical protein KJO07_15300 [Deltaproteobacteria bacterium]|nr:hypothetical protein [Deltaproteobacteria bacterium]